MRTVLTGSLAASPLACAGRTAAVPSGLPPVADCRREEADYVQRAAHEGWPLMETFATPLDPAIWQVQPYSFPENGCVMNDSAVAVQNGTLTLTVRARHGEPGGAPSPDDDGKVCVGGEIYSVQAFPKAHMTACVRTEASPGTVAAFFAMSPFQQPVWNQQEIDVEWPGRDLGLVQFNTHNLTRPPDTDFTGTPALYPLGFAASGGFHRYEFEWDRTKTRFWIDGEIAHVRTTDTPTASLQVRFNHYAVTPSLPWAAGWVGAFSDGSLPTRTVVDWVAIRRLK